MTIDRRTGEREDTPEQDVERGEMAEATLFGRTVTKLLETSATTAPGSFEFLKRMDLHLNVLRRPLARDDRNRLKELAWKYRRQIDAPLAPKLPPHDPVVQAMDDES